MIRKLVRLDEEYLRCLISVLGTCNDLSETGRARFWDGKGAFFRIVEEIPGLGYAVAVADFIRGDPVSGQPVRHAHTQY